MRESDPPLFEGELEEITAFLSAVHADRGDETWSVSDLLSTLPIEVVPRCWRFRGPHLSNLSLGRRLSGIEGRTFGNLVVARRHRGAGHALHWQVREPGQGSPPPLKAAPVDPNPQIDWLSRADGEQHILVKGEHYTREESKVRHAATVWAHRHNLRALSELAPLGIRIRFVPSQGKV